MSRRKENISPATAEDHKAVNAPLDLWARLEALTGIDSSPLPMNSFTAKQYSKTANLSARAARERLMKLVDAGKLERRQRKGTYYYYFKEEQGRSNAGGNR